MTTHKPAKIKRMDSSLMVTSATNTLETIKSMAFLANASHIHGSVRTKGLLYAMKILKRGPESFV